SDAPIDPAPYAPDRAVARILALLDELGHEKVLLCGHSLGAALCLRLALDAPERLAGLILINSMSAAGTPEWRDDARPGMVTMAGRLRAEGSDFLRSTRLYPAHSKRLDPESRELLMRAFDATDPHGLAGTAESLVIDVNSFERLGDLEVPTLVVVGQRDKAFADAAPDFIERMPAVLVRRAHLADAGHAANIEQPEAFESAVIAFAEDLGYLPPAPVPLIPPAGTGRGGLTLTTVGGALVIGGLALLAGAFLFSRGGGDSGASVAASSDGATTTPTTVSLVAGTRAAGSGSGATSGSSVPNTPLPATATASAATPTATTAPSQAAGATTIPATATVRPTSTPESTPTATTVPPTPSPTTPPATPTPSGPQASISGPGAASVGTPVGFVGGASGGTVIGQPLWTAGGGSVAAPNPFAPTITFTQAGCQSVTVTFNFAGGAKKTASMVVPVGGAHC
ncbi:MAG: alpha/beta fold hydrolase, partial [Anaerolineaceae bacterium]